MSGEDRVRTQDLWVASQALWLVASSPMYTTCEDSHMYEQSKALLQCKPTCTGFGILPRRSRGGQCASLTCIRHSTVRRCRRRSTLTRLVVNNLESTGLSRTLSTSSGHSTTSLCEDPWYQYNIVSSSSSDMVCIP